MLTFWDGFEKRSAAWSDAIKKQIIKPRKPPKPGPALDYAEIAKELPAVEAIPTWKRKMLGSSK